MRQTIALIDCGRNYCARCELELPKGFCRAHNEHLDLDRRGKALRLRACIDGEAAVRALSQPGEQRILRGWQCVNKSADNVTVVAKNWTTSLRLTVPEAAALCAELLRVLADDPCLFPQQLGAKSGEEK